MAAVNWDNPCEAAAALRKAIGDLAIGKRAEVVELEVGTGSRRRVHMTKVSMKELRAEYLKRAEECQALTSTVKKRFAII